MPKDIILLAEYPEWLPIADVLPISDLEAEQLSVFPISSPEISNQEISKEFFRRSRPDDVFSLEAQLRSLLSV
jgi:hypothetical protein